MRNEINKASTELKIAIFCCLVSVLSFAFAKIEPSVGVLLFYLVSPTGLTSWVIFVYKMIFGSIKDVFSIILVTSMYISLLAVPFHLGTVVRCSLLVVFLSLIIKIFLFIFFRKKKETVITEQNNTEQTVKSNSLAVVIAIVLLIVNCSVYVPLILSFDILAEENGKLSDALSLFKKNEIIANLSVTKNDKKTDNKKNDVNVDNNSQKNDKSLNKQSSKQQVIGENNSNKVQYTKFTDAFYGYSFEYPSNYSVMQGDHSNGTSAVWYSFKFADGSELRIGDLFAEQTFDLEMKKEIERYGTYKDFSFNKTSNNSYKDTYTFSDGTYFEKHATFKCINGKNITIYAMYIHKVQNTPDKNTLDVVKYMMDSLKIPD